LGGVLGGQKLSLEEIVAGPKAGHFLGGKSGLVLGFQERIGLLELVLERLEPGGKGFEVFEGAAIFLEGLCFLLSSHGFEEGKIGGCWCMGEWVSNRPDARGRKLGRHSRFVVKPIPQGAEEVLRVVGFCR